MSKTPIEMQQQEEFFEWFALINTIAEKQGVSIYKIWNARQIWDYAYEKGVTAGLQSARQILKESNLGK